MKFKLIIGTLTLLLILVSGCSNVTVQSPIKIQQPIPREEAIKIAEDFMNAVAEYPPDIKIVNAYLEDNYWKVGMMSEMDKETGILYINAKTGKVEYLEENGVKTTADDLLKK